MAKHVTIRSGDSPRLALPMAVVSCLDVLIERAKTEGYAAADLIRLRQQIAAIYKLPLRGKLASDVDVAQELEEQDGEPLDDAP